MVLSKSDQDPFSKFMTSQFFAQSMPWNYNDLKHKSTDAKCIQKYLHVVELHCKHNTSGTTIRWKHLSGPTDCSGGRSVRLWWSGVAALFAKPWTPTQSEGRLPPILWAGFTALYPISRGECDCLGVVGAKRTL